ncbi:E3 ubiquitin ligase [Coemansia guatemalensis]|uniref:E3 ubiquitin ligase n=1 Tax=Coemansia guatemalensis TaxID=2761395 RepID=A0A9W8LPL8_9FUNG|nr:E3 ubiquitin ligase [Coemansia guatemalensis]
MVCQHRIGGRKSNESLGSHRSDSRNTGSGQPLLFQPWTRPSRTEASGDVWGAAESTISHRPHRLHNSSSIAAPQLTVASGERTSSVLPIRSDVLFGGDGAEEIDALSILRSRYPIVVHPPQPSEGTELGLLATPLKRNSTGVEKSRDTEPVDCASSSSADASSYASGSSVYEMAVDHPGALESDGGEVAATGDCTCCHTTLGQRVQGLQERIAALDAEVAAQQTDLTAAETRVAQVSEALQCAVCLEMFSQPHSLACGHTFCQGCLLEWLSQRRQCPTCRASVSQRPAVAFAVQDAVRCLAPPASSSTAASADTLQSPDPWASLFPTTSLRSSLVECNVCARVTLAGCPCPYCAVDALYQSVETRLDTPATSSRQPSSIRISRLTRRPHETQNTERLLDSVRRLRNSYASTRAQYLRSHRSAFATQNTPSLRSAATRGTSYATASGTNTPHFTLRRPRASPSPSPPESLFDPADLIEGRRADRRFTPSPPLTRGNQPPRSLSHIPSYSTLLRSVSRSDPPFSAVPPPRNASQAEYIMHNGYQSAYPSRPRSPPSVLRLTPPLRPRSPGPRAVSRREYAEHSRDMINDYMLHLDDADSSADDAAEPTRAYLDNQLLLARARSLSTRRRSTNRPPSPTDAWDFP